MKTKTYIFTYFFNNSDGKCVSREFPVRASRFTHAFYCFARFFNDVETSGNFRDYSLTYVVVCNGKVFHRTLSSKYLSSLHRFVPEV